MDTTTRAWRVAEGERALLDELHELRVARMREADEAKRSEIEAMIYAKKRELLRRQSVDEGVTVVWGEPRTCTVRPTGDDRRATAVARSLWSYGQREIRVGFVDGDAEQRRLVREIASEWNKYSGLALRFVDEAAVVRVGFAAGWGSWSYIGTDCLNVLGGPTVNFGWVKAGMDEGEARRVILHEFGHVLGLVHEHQNPAGGVPWDLAAVYRHYAGPPNYWSRAQVDAQVLAVYERDQIRGTEFDRESIMLYPIPGELTGGKLRVGWNREISEQDKAFVAMVYGSVDGG